MLKEKRNMENWTIKIYIDKSSPYYEPYMGDYMYVSGPDQK
jgi:hypothetical protein